MSYYSDDDLFDDETRAPSLDLNTGGRQVRDYEFQNNSQAQGFGNSFVDESYGNNDNSNIHNTSNNPFDEINNLEIPTPYGYNRYAVHQQGHPQLASFMPPPPPELFTQSWHPEKQKSGSQYSYSTMVDDDSNEKLADTPKKIRSKKNVTFNASEPRIPSNTYNGMNYDNDDLDMVMDMDMDEYMDSPMVPRVIDFNGENYGINPLEDAVGNDFDPFADEESLFSEASDDLRRNGTLKRSQSIRYDMHEEGDDDDDEFKPKLNYTRTIKKAKLVDGNYVVDCPVPNSLLDTYGRKIIDCGHEMKFLRYSAVTCGPSNFLNHKYNLRQLLYSPKRETEIMCVITMYNEDEILLAKTLQGVFENIQNLTNRRDPCWGEDSWKKVVIVIINDGRISLNKRTEKLLTALGIYQETYAKSKINNQNVKSHLFEYTSTVGIEKINEKIHLCSNDNPVQFVFCLKEKNSRKINSHRWAFQSIAPVLNPRVVLLLDCGTRPNKDSFYHLWKSFNDPNVAGACGEMKTALGPNKNLLINPLVAAQNFEYKISNVLDKPMESVFGFISVLPGAFSAYRYEALLNVNGKGPLEKYFKGEFLHQNSQIEDDDDEKELKEKNFQDVGIFTSNMYLAEDRILCFELVAKKGYNYILRYVNEAKAETDVPETIEDFVLQRRRWLNGSLFAACYSVFHWTKIWKSNHSLLRKLVLQVEFYYQFLVILVSWFSLASFFLVFRVLTANLGSEEVNFEIGKYLSIIFLWCYVAAIVITFVLAFGNTPRGTRKFYMVIAIVFAVLMAYMLFSAIYLAIHTIQSVLLESQFEVIMLFTNQKFRDLVISMVSTYALYIVASLMYGEPSFMVTSFFQYILLSPTYVNVLNIYSFCNIDDISWGTRDKPEAKDLGQAKSSNNEDILMVVNGLEKEMNEHYLNTLDELRTVPPPIEKINQKKGKDDAYYALVRTLTVLIWMFTNAVLVCVVLEIGGVDKLMHQSDEYTHISPNAEIFLSIILWIVAGLALYRFFGSALYLVFKVFRPLKWKMRQSKSK